jgi:NAD(P)-dependent dehydrogenase (short-subunit alcohol dehydrogenase family)
MAAARPVALVTGAGGGLGGAIARALASCGFDLVLNDLSETTSLLTLVDASAALGARAVTLAANIASDAGRAHFVDEAFAAFGRLDCLVNNAGVSVLDRGDILDVSPESFDRCVSVNLRAQFFVTQAVAKRMLAAPAPERRRTIITITTVAVDQLVGKVLAEYCIAKAGLAHAHQHFAARLASEGIDCYEVRPGMMKTDMTATTREKYDALIAAGFVPEGRWGDTSDVGSAVAALAGGTLSYATGQTLHIDGGMRFKVF